jgi:hypothetical protein
MADVVAVRKTHRGAGLHGKDMRNEHPILLVHHRRPARQRQRPSFGNRVNDSIAHSLSARILDVNFDRRCKQRQCYGSRKQDPKEWAHAGGNARIVHRHPGGAQM